jgi:hypothetical protein
VRALASIRAGTLLEQCLHMLDTETARALLKPRMAVVCSRRVQFATVDHVEGGAVAVDDAAGVSHLIPLQWITSVDDKVHIDRPGARAMREWTSEPSPSDRSGERSRP